MFSDLIERVREASDIVSIIGERVALKNGQELHWLVPFPPGKTLLYRFPDKQLFLFWLPARGRCL